MKKDKFESEIASDLAHESGMPVAEASKSKKSSKSASVNALAIAPPTLTLVADPPNTIEWTLPTADELGALTPEDATDDRVLLITAIQWGGINPTTTLWEASGGIEIKQFSRNPQLTQFVNEYVAASRLNVSPIPKGAIEVRVGHITAQKNGDSYFADTIDKPEAIAWSTPLAVEFT